MEFPIVANDLCVRPFAEGDAAAFVSAVHESVATVGAWMPWCRLQYTAQDARSWFEQSLAALRAGTAYDVGIFSADGALLLGGVGINQLNLQHNFGNIGYWVRESQQRRGVATRAVRIMAAHGFDRLPYLGSLDEKFLFQ